LFVHLLSGAIVLAVLWFFILAAPLPTLPRQHEASQHLQEFRDRIENAEAREFMLATRTGSAPPPKWWVNRLATTMSKLVDNVALSDLQVNDIMRAAAMEDEDSKGGRGSSWAALLVRPREWIRRLGGSRRTIIGPFVVTQANEKLPGSDVSLVEPSVKQVNFFCVQSVSGTSTTQPSVFLAL
jgi:hypothetical protein